MHCSCMAFELQLVCASCCRVADVMEAEEATPSFEDATALQTSGVPKSSCHEYCAHCLQGSQSLTTGVSYTGSAETTLVTMVQVV